MGEFFALLLWMFLSKAAEKKEAAHGRGRKQSLLHCPGKVEQGKGETEFMCAWEKTYTQRDTHMWDLSYVHHSGLVNIVALGSGELFHV